MTTGFISASASPSSLGCAEKRKVPFLAARSHLYQVTGPRSDVKPISHASSAVVRFTITKSPAWSFGMASKSA